MKQILLTLAIIQALSCYSFSYNSQNGDAQVQLQRTDLLKVDYQQKAARLEANIDQLQETVAAQEDENNTLQVRLSARQAELNNLKRVLTLNMSKVAQLRGDLKLAVHQHQNLKDLIADYREKIAGLEGSGDVKQITLEKYRLKLSELEYQSKNLQQKRTTWEINVNSQEALIASLKNQIDDLVARYQVGVQDQRDLIAVNVNMKVTYKDLKAQYDAISFDIAVVSKRNATLQVQLDAFNADFQALRARYNALKAESDGYIADLKAAKKVHTALVRDVEYFSSKRSRDEKTLEKLNQDNELLNVQISRLTDHNNLLKEELAGIRAIVANQSEEGLNYILIGAGN